MKKTPATAARKGSVPGGGASFPKSPAGALEKNLRQFRAFADFSADWEYFVGVDGLMIYVSPSCERICGYSPKEFLSDDSLLKKIIHPDDSQKFFGHDKEPVSPQGSPGEKPGKKPPRRSRRKCGGAEFRIIKKDGSVAHIDHVCQPVYDEKGNFLGRRASNRDITGRVQAEEDRRESEMQLHAVLESTADGILAVNNEGKVLQANWKFARLWRIPMSLMESDDEKAMLDFVLHQLADPEAFISKVRSLQNSDAEDLDNLNFKDGRIFERFSVPMMRDGERIGRVWSFRDVTERERAKIELQKKNTELEAFTYTVSHDLKSPLVTIKTFLGFLEEDLHAKNREAVAKDLHFMHAATQKMEELLGELLRLARVGHLASAPEDFLLQDVAREALKAVAGQIATRKVRVEVTSRPVVLRGDRTRLAEVFQNLIDNAVKFMGRQRSPRIEIGAKEEAGAVAIFVSDNGQGVDPRHLPKLFGLFEKLDPGSPGVGLGLAMVRRIIEAHGGKIQALSKGPGKGTTFRFALPGARFLEERHERKKTS